MSSQHMLLEIIVRPRRREAFALCSVRPVEKVSASGGHRAPKLEHESGPAFPSSGWEETASLLHTRYTQRALL